MLNIMLPSPCFRRSENGCPQCERIVGLRKEERTDGDRNKCQCLSKEGIRLGSNLEPKGNPQYDSTTTVMLHSEDGCSQGKVAERKNEKQNKRMIVK